MCRAVSAAPGAQTALLSPELCVGAKKHKPRSSLAKPSPGDANPRSKRPSGQSVRPKLDPTDPPQPPTHRRGRGLRQQAWPIPVPAVPHAALELWSGSLLTALVKLETMRTHLRATACRFWACAQLQDRRRQHQKGVGQPECLIAHPSTAQGGRSNPCLSVPPSRPSQSTRSPPQSGAYRPPRACAFHCRL